MSGLELFENILILLIGEAFFVFIGLVSRSEKKKLLILVIGTIFVGLIGIILFVSSGIYRNLLAAISLICIAVVSLIFCLKQLNTSKKFVVWLIGSTILLFGSGLWFGYTLNRVLLKDQTNGLPIGDAPRQAPKADHIILTDTPEIEKKGTFTFIPTQTNSVTSTITSTITPTVTSTFTLSPTPAITLPFSDTFEPKPKEAWDFFRGEWHGYEGHLTGQLGLNQRQIALVGDKNWRNYRISVECYSYDFIYPVHIILRASHENYLLFRFAQLSGINWTSVNRGDETVIASKSMTFPRRFKTSYVFMIEAKDDILTAFVDEEQVSQVQIPASLINSFSSGMVGVGYEPAGHLVWFDDFKVEEIP